MVDVSELIEDSDFATTYYVNRSIGEWIDGRFKLKEENKLKYYGVVQPATEEEIEQLDIGDKNKLIMKFMCAYPNEIFVTSSTEGQYADVIEYNNKKYKVIKVKQWKDSGGYCRAFACEFDV